MKVSSVHAALDQLAPSQAFRSEWEDVLERADLSLGLPGRAERFGVSRRVVLALAVLAAVLIPLGALAAANEWWFLRLGDPPAPATDVVVVRTGNWGGYEWQLVAYRTAGEDVCFSFTPADAEMRGKGGAMGCASIEQHGITLLTGSAGADAPSYLVGPVIGSAREVVIHSWSGETLRTQTFPAPESFGNVRFYATELTTAVTASRRATPGEFVEKLVGLDADGGIVACLVLPVANDEDGLSGCE